MLSVWGRGATSCDGITRREVLRIGGLAFGGMMLPDVLRRQAEAGVPAGNGHSVIMVWLRGGASHIDSFDMKPDMPPEVRGEFSPIETNVPGIRVCEYLPRHAEMMDKLAIIRGIRSNDLGDHTPHYINTGFPDRGKRPQVGSVVSYLQNRTDGMPAFVSTYDWKPYEVTSYTGPAHAPFIPNGAGLNNLGPNRDVPVTRLDGRRDLLGQFDAFRRRLDDAHGYAAHDAFTTKALQTIASTRVRDAFDLKGEPEETHQRYGKYCESLLLARRVAEAGVSVVSVKLGDWDTHEHNFRDMRDQLPQLDQGMHALVSDLYERGLEKKIAVVVWGEFGRAPRVSRIAGRDHWPDAGAAVVAGGGFQVGQVIGETERDAGRSKGNPYTPSNVIATLYRHLGIDPAVTIPDHNRRPMHVLDDREVVRELVS